MSEAVEFWMLYGDGRKHWVARFYDRGDEQFYTGEGESAWLAVAWAFDERAHRRHGIVRPARDPDAKPTLVVDPRLIAAQKAHQEAMEEAERVVRLPLAEAPCTKSKSAAARRARTKKQKPGASH